MAGSTTPVSGASLAPIRQRIGNAPTHHPSDAQVFIDPTMEAGDIVKFKRGEEEYSTHLDNVKQVWRGGALQATTRSGGEKERPAVAREAKRKYSRSGAGMRNNAGIRSYVEAADKSIYSYIYQTETYIAQGVESVESRMGSAIIQTAEQIYSEVHAADSQLYSYIDQTATYIEQAVVDATSDMGSAIYQTAEQIYSEVHAANSQIYSYIDQTATYIEQAVVDATSDMGSAIYQTAEQIYSEVHAANSQIYSYIDQTATYIEQAVVDATSDMGSAIYQTAEQIYSEVHAASSDLYSYVDQTATSIQSHVENVESGLRTDILQNASAISLEAQRAQDAETTLAGRLTVQADKVGMTVEVKDSREVKYYHGISAFPDTGDPDYIYMDVTTSKYYEWKNGQYVICDGPGGTIKAGDICVAINESSETEATIQADKIYLLGTTIANTINADYISTKIASLSVVNMKSVTVSGSGANIGVEGIVYATDFILGTKTGGPNNVSLKNGIKELRITSSGNTCMLQKKNFSDADWVDVGSFSRAVSSWVWGGGDGKINVTALPQSQTKSVKVSIDGTSSIAANGTYTYTVDYENGDGDDMSTGATKTVTVALPYEPTSLGQWGVDAGDVSGWTKHGSYGDTFYTSGSGRTTSVRIYTYPVITIDGVSRNFSDYSLNDYLYGAPSAVFTYAYDAGQTAGRNFYIASKGSNSGWSSGTVTVTAYANPGGTEISGKELSKTIVGGTASWNGRTVTIPINERQGSAPYTYVDTGLSVSATAPLAGAWEQENPSSSANPYNKYNVKINGTSVASEILSTSTSYNSSNRVYTVSVNATSRNSVITTTVNSSVTSWTWGGGDGKINVTALPQSQTKSVKVSIDGTSSITANGTYTYTVDYENGDGDDVSTGATKTVTVALPYEPTALGQNGVDAGDVSGWTKHGSYADTFYTSGSGRTTNVRIYAYPVVTIDGKSRNFSDYSLKDYLTGAPSAVFTYAYDLGYAAPPYTPTAVGQWGVDAGAISGWTKHGSYGDTFYTSGSGRTTSVRIYTYPVITIDGKSRNFNDYGLNSYLTGAPSAVFTNGYDAGWHAYYSACSYPAAGTGSGMTVYWPSNTVDSAYNSESRTYSLSIGNEGKNVYLQYNNAIYATINCITNWDTTAPESYDPSSEGGKYAGHSNNTGYRYYLKSTGPNGEAGIAIKMHIYLNGTPYYRGCYLEAAPTDVYRRGYSDGWGAARPNFNYNGKDSGYFEVTYATATVGTNNTVRYVLTQSDSTIKAQIFGTTNYAAQTAISYTPSRVVLQDRDIGTVSGYVRQTSEGHAFYCQAGVLGRNRKIRIYATPTVTINGQSINFWEIYNSQGSRTAIYDYLESVITKVYQFGYDAGAAGQ